MQASKQASSVRWFACRFVAGLQHVFQSWRKPFNPILGETWQAQLSDGTVMYMEQLSHHPPVTAFHMIGAGTCLPFPYHTRTQLLHLTISTLVSSLTLSICRTGVVFAEESVTSQSIFCSLAVSARVLIYPPGSLCGPQQCTLLHGLAGC